MASQSMIARLDSTHYILVRDRFIAKADELKAKLHKNIHIDIDPMIALRNVFEAEHAYIVNGYLVVYDITTMWWSDTPILAEQLVFALEPDSSFLSVIEFFEAKAIEVGAKYIAVGTALSKSDRALAAVYAKHGFKQMAINLAKEV